jgi:hypothetical protein
MPSKNTDQTRKPAQNDKSAKGKGELHSKDLDKVTGGLSSRPGTIGNTREPVMGG